MKNGLPYVGGCDLIVHKRARLLRRRQNTQQIEVSTPHEHFIGAEFRGIHAERAQLGEDLLVDVVVGWRILPNKAGPRRHESQSHRFLAVQVAHQHGGFPCALALHQSVMRHLGQTIRRFIHSERGNVARDAICEKRLYPQLHFGRRLDQYFFLRRKDYALQFWRGSQVVGHPLGDPPAEDFVFLRALLEAQAAFVRDLRGGLQENEALLRLYGVDAASK